MKFLISFLFTLYVLTLLSDKVSTFTSFDGCQNYSTYYCTIVQARETKDDCKLLACFIGLGSCYAAQTKEMMLHFDQVLEDYVHLTDSKGKASFYGGTLGRDDARDAVIMVLKEDEHA